VRGVVHVVKLLKTVQLGEHCFWVLFFDGFYVFDVAKVQLVNNVAYI
jgi:hypothetical protein